MSKQDLLHSILGDLTTYELERTRCPAREGVYVLLDETGEPIYVGQSVNFESRIGQHTAKPWVKALLLPVADGKRFRLQVETALMRLLKPKLNLITAEEKDGIRGSHGDVGLERSEEVLKDIVHGKYLPEREREIPETPTPAEDFPDAYLPWLRFRDEKAPFGGPRLFDEVSLLPQVMLGEHLIRCAYPEFRDPRADRRCYYRTHPSLDIGVNRVDAAWICIFKEDIPTWTQIKIGTPVRIESTFAYGGEDKYAQIDGLTVFPSRGGNYVKLPGYRI